ncbi:glycosyltransferase family 4 protein [Dokdonia genika]|uniref:Glycosyltransferase family 4 protein n=1 Tax=Dokdonia genika TaxID=308113 RepID=A0ABV9LC77_9FLAO
MHILHINGSRPWGGNEQQLIDMVIELEKLGVKNTIFCARDSELSKALKIAGIDFIEAPHSKFKNAENKKEYARVKKAIAPDIIHLHTSNAIMFFMKEYIFSKNKIPAILSKKGMGSSMSFFSKFKYNFKGIKKIICISKHTASQMREQIIFKKNWSRLEVVYDGIQLDRMVKNEINLREKLDTKCDIKLVGNIANHTPAKDLHTFIKSIHHLVNTLGERKIHIVQIGAPSKHTQALKDEVTHFKLSSYITFLGAVPNASGLLPQLDAHVLTSEREGMGLVNYESFYYKIPVICTAAGGIPEVVKDRETGRLAPIKDYKAIAQAIKDTLIEDLNTKKYVDKAYQELMENYTTGSTTKQIFNIYQKVIAL